MSGNRYHLETTNKPGIEFEIVNLTPEYITDNFNKLLAIESNWTEIGEELWTLENFLFELPMKKELSFSAESDDSIIGYLIGSKYNPVLSRVNKIIIDSPHRGNGVGKQLMNKYFDACRDRDIIYSQLKAFPNNEPANKFYMNLGYEKVNVVRGRDDKLRNVYEKKLI